MYQAVFISDLHLHPERPDISERFNNCIDWVQYNSQKLYILGDFFHVWAGDDAFDAWSLAIAHKLKQLSQAGIAVYFMVGNRDFLLGSCFVQESGVIMLAEPTVIYLDNTPVLLVHGDRYCTDDVAHQRFRKLSRNPTFIRFFLKIPFVVRNWLVNGVRQRSEQGVYYSELMSTVPEAVVAHMQEQQVQVLIHGHTHQPGLIQHGSSPQIMKQYILSDWDDKPHILCYDKAKGIHFIQMF